MLLASYKLTPTLAPMVRLGFVAQRRAGDGSGRNVVREPDSRPDLRQAGGQHPLRRVRWAERFPIGMGGGDMPDAGAATANAAGIAARSAMDNAMFAVNYFTAIVGGGVGYVDHKFTLQAEVTLLQLFRVRGGMAPPPRPTRPGRTRRPAFTPATSCSRCFRWAASCAISVG